MPLTPTGQSAPGVTATSVSVGVAIEDDTKAANAALGAGAIDHGNETDEYHAVRDYINRHGGLGGRTLQLVEFHYDTTTSADVATLDEAGCAYMTQDHKVFAVVNVPTDKTINACLTQRGVLTLGQALTNWDASASQRFPGYLQPTAMNLNRQARVMIEGLAEQRYFGNQGKVGLITYDDPAFRSAAETLQSALTDLGVAPATVAYIGTAQRESDLSTENAQVANAVLNFRSHGVDHVTFLDHTGVLTLLFLENASSQHYHPRYGFNSQSGAGALQAIGSIPNDQFIGSLAVGWVPRLDLTAGQPEQQPPGEALCLRILTKAGITPDGNDAVKHADDICDSLFFLQAAIDHTPAPLTRASVVLAATHLTPAEFQPAETYAVNVRPPQYDGVAAVRDVAYFTSCQCFRYSQPFQRLS